MIKATNIRWETDDKVVSLPDEVDIPEEIIDRTCDDDFLENEDNIDNVNNYLSNTYNWLVDSYTLVEVE